MRTGYHTNTAIGQYFQGIILTVAISRPAMSKIPEVDASSAAAAEQVREACIDFGFFYLVNHGISDQLMKQVYAEMEHFFGQPLSEKTKVLANQYVHGYTPMSEELLDHDVQTQGDTKEGYYICRPVEPDEVGLPLHGPNVFPDQQTYPNFQRVMEAYFEAMSALSLRVARLFAEAAGAPGASNAPGMFDRPLTALRLVHYDAIKSDLDGGVLACGAHTDFGLVTLLSTDENPGLQIWHDGEWIDVPPRQDAYIVNIGDLGERWTNGLFRSTRHRVMNTNGKDRYSVPFFLQPNFHCKVECLSSCVTVDRPLRYPPTTAGEHVLSQYRATRTRAQLQK